jgi:hypothetical protein
MNRDDLITELYDLQAQLTRGCRMNHCIINPPTGMAPNGGCRCTKDQISRRLRQLSEDVMDIRRDNWFPPTQQP